MRNISKYIYESKLNEIYFNELTNIEINESYNIINESFQSSWLTLLAKKIKDIEAGNLSAKNWKDKYSFTSIFGPKVEKGKWNTKKLRSIKWSEITDADFELYDKKRLKKILIEIKKKESNTGVLIISCAPGTKNIIKFFNGLGTAPFKEGGTWVHSYDDVLYTIKTDYKVEYHYDDNGKNTGNTKTYYNKVGEVTRSKYKYNERTLKDLELYQEMKDFDNYVLVLDNSMFTEYKSLTDKRDKDKEGMVLLDDESLKKLAKEQNARYKALAEEIRRKRLVSKDKELFQEIKATQDELNDLIEKIMGKSDSYSEYSSLREALQYTYRAMDYFSDYLRETYESSKHQKEYAKYGDVMRHDYYGERAQGSIADSKKQLDRAKGYIEEIKKNL